MSSIVSDESFASNLRQERKMTEIFLDILKKEQEALIGDDIERLETLPRDKAEIVMQLAELARQRDKALIEQSLSTDRKGMETLLARRSDAETVTVEWHELLRLAEAAQQLNQINGEIITTRLRHNQRSLVAIQNATGAAPLYGPTGKTSTLKGGRQLGQV